MIVAFSGHRPDKLGGYELPNPTYIKICKEIEKTVKDLKAEKIISGMALGVDQWAASIAIKLGIPFVAAVPFLGQEGMWPNKSKKIYKFLLDKAGEIVIVCEGGFTAKKLQLRNEWMVDNCDVLIAVYNGDEKGGTANCVRYAKEKKKEIVFITP